MTDTQVDKQGGQQGYRKSVIADQSPEMLLVESKMVAMAIGCDLVGEASDGDMLLQIVDEMIILASEIPPERGVHYAKIIQDIHSIRGSSSGFP